MSSEFEVDYDDCDSGGGTDEFDLLELGGTGEEFCQVGDQTCSIPFELYDLPGLEHILSMDVWNDVLTETQRLNLTKYLPDMDQEHFMRTMKDLFTGVNFHFGVPVNKLFDMLKGGLCEPRVALYRQGVGFFRKHQRYHVIRKHQNNMVNSLVQINRALSNYRGYSVEEKFRVLNIIKSQKRLVYETMVQFETEDSSSEESEDRLWSNKKQKWDPHYPGYGSRKQNPKGTKKFSGPSGSSSFLAREMRDREERTMYDITLPRNPNMTDKIGKRFRGFRGEEFQETLTGVPVPLKIDMNAFGGNRTVNRLSDIQVLTAKPSNSRFSYDYGKKLKQMDSQQDSYWHQSLGESVDLYRMGMKKGRMVNTENGRRVVAAAEGMQMLAKGEETESDSSENFGEDDDENPLMRSKWAYPSVMKPGPNFKKPKLGGKNNKYVTGGGTKRIGEFGNDYFTLPPMHINNYATGYSGQDHHDMVDVTLLECNSKKRRVKDGVMYMDDLDQESQRQGQSQLDDGYLIPEATVMNITEEDADLENKTQKKPFTLITPTVHTGFSFSIIHLLSAVRMAMITLLSEDNANDEVKQEAVHGDQDDPNVPSLTVKDIVNRVRSNPGDPCILETQEPLQDLVRGVLKIFASKTAPLGAKGWKPLVLYKKSIKSWSWVGPVSHISSDHEIVEEVTSPDSWDLPHKMLVKLVDSFANWLKCGQETLKQIGSLPDPPLTLMQVNLDEKERFRDLRAQRSLNTINPSSDEVRDYFRKEEVLRYLIPDRAFAYTAIDGKKSTIAPSRKGAGKPTSKARDHFMLKRDRPPHVTILCLVRDAAARLPGSIGTRADVCTLIRDSQYIVEDVSDAQVNQVVSGALDRLHYERDPCVQFDGERKLWVYLHREREEEDFEDDGTSSTKKWKRQKKEPVEPSDPGGAVTLEPCEFDLSIEPINEQKNSNDQGYDDDVEILINTSVS